MVSEPKIRMLGTLEVSDGAGFTGIGSAKRRAVLAVLLIRAGEVVRVEQLIDELWGAEPPGSAATQVHGHVSRLRRALGDEDGTVLVTDEHGYRLEVADRQLDVGEFDELVRRGLAVLRRGESAAAADLLRAALALWRGNPLSDVVPTELVTTATERLLERWLDAWESTVDAELMCGRHASIVAELTQQVELYPLRERMWRQLMLALHRTGRQAEALATFQRARRTWMTELGEEPSAELRRLHQELLAPVDRVVPRQLPAAPAFVGRAIELSRLGGGTTAIVGGAGVGKTALALHWGALAADRFPDGQLYIDLRGFDRRHALTPAAVLARFLQALGVPAPDDEDERAAVYRTTLSDRRMLVVLDNARDAEHVRPLLPGPSPAEVLITSRDDLRGLVVTHGVHRLTLDRLAPADAEAVLTHVLGPGDFGELAELCDFLPLALRIAAANLSARPQQTVADLVAVLRTGDPLTELSVAGDPVIGVRAALDVTYAALTTEERRVFSLLDEDVTAVGPEVDRLAALHLVTPAGPYRHTMSTLVRRYARDVAGN
jgi:DNA-binding SARP family transcriptional activator